LTPSFFLHNFLADYFPTDY